MAVGGQTGGPQLQNAKCKVQIAKFKDRTVEGQTPKIINYHDFRGFHQVFNTIILTMRTISANVRSSL